MRQYDKMYVVESIVAGDYHYKSNCFFLMKHKNKADTFVPVFGAQNVIIPCDVTGNSLFKIKVI